MVSSAPPQLPIKRRERELGHAAGLAYHEERLLGCDASRERAPVAGALEPSQDIDLLNDGPG